MMYNSLPHLYMNEYTLGKQMAAKKYIPYVLKLKDPRWQKKRLEVFEHNNFTCSGCGATDKTLNAHHPIYEKDKEPWEYPNETLMCLCDDCHYAAHDEEALLDYFVKLVKTGGLIHGHSRYRDIWFCAGMLSGLVHEEGMEFIFFNEKYAAGISHYLNIDSKELIKQVVEVEKDYGKQGIIPWGAIDQMQRDGWNKEPITEDHPYLMPVYDLQKKKSLIV
jgi:hypothetical protein